MKVCFSGELTTLMGRVFDSELQLLKDTLEWSLDSTIDPLQAFVREAKSAPLVSVGSGGSATAAHYAATLHRVVAASSARHTTPLDVLLTESDLSRSAVWLFSASGSNHDVLAALEHSVRGNAKSIGTLCTRKSTKLGTAARRYDQTYVFENEGPSKRDGFLATNSLLASCVLVARAYGVPVALDIEDCDYPDLPELKGRDTVEILHGGWSSPVATDLESKINESALHSALTSDYRNFGHGRHLRLARRPSETLIVALITPDTRRIAAQTLSLIPDAVQILKLETDRDGPLGTLELLVQGFWLVGALGRIQSVDPGRPSVPDFGRKIFHLRPSVRVEDVPSPVVRKLASLGLSRTAQREWRLRLSEFVGRLESMTIGGVVLDFDGTICAPDERFSGVRHEVGAELRRLLEAGLTIGIASGRGRSVREALQKALPENLWPSVVMGYYNGGQIGTLENDDVPVRTTEPEYELGLARDLLTQDDVVLEQSTMEVRRQQISIVPEGQVTTEALLKHVMAVLSPIETIGIRTLSSSHSIDVLSPGVSKLSVLHEVSQKAKAETEILSIGDRGAWPGNDVALLARWPSLSVDETSGSPTVCWNLAPAGTVGVSALLVYLRSMEVCGGVATIRADGLWNQA